ncbi:MFS transporter [Thalassococcus sp. S3]|uniref:MFS transporter n=1 Tax=Thalassococcus sp. S3 TaxID=2017482 RepID=UPI00102412AF|nr:MFS transporter [Thalassococcus sp. S3]QBF29607.1 MFS transporter [Thalassococcus sp. S3]
MRSARFIAQNAPWLGAGFVLTFLSSFGQTFFISIFAGDIRSAFGLSHGVWGGIYTLGTTASAIAMVWAGTLTDRYRVRVLGPVILSGLAAACLFMALNPVVWLLPLVIFMLRFTGQGMTSQIAMVAMARWFSKIRGRALSVASLGFAVGEAALPLLFVTLMSFLDWRLLWGLAALAVLSGIPVLLKLLTEERTPQSISTKDDALGMEDRHWTRLEAVRHPLFWFMVPALLGPAAFNTAFFFHQVHLAEVKGISHAAFVALFPIYTSIAVLTMIASGWAIDRFGTARMMPIYQLPMVFSFAIFAVAGTIWGLVAGFVCLALTTGANGTLPAAFWAEFYGTAHIGSIKAMAAAVMVFGSAIGPGITGLLIDFGIPLETQFFGIAAYFLFVCMMATLGIARTSIPARV